MARHVWAGHRLVQDHELIHPSRDWLLGLGTGVLITGGIIAWSGQLYLTYRDNPQVSVDQTESDVVIYRAPLVESARISLLERGVAAAVLKNQLPNTLVVPPTPPVTATTTVLEETIEDVVGEQSPALDAQSSEQVEMSFD